ncbi:MAG: EamA family transporter, partial [Candidatus Aureabacteria bacterium]|nr:EamA family transporter [Candidatus Auribacterota bacterium]
APIPALSGRFFFFLFLAQPLELTAALLYLKAIKISPLSLTVPFLSFTPVFLLFAGALFLGETVTFLGVFGIGLVCGGSYVLYLEKGMGDIFLPLRSLFRERGSLLMLLVSLIFSFTAPMGKRVIQESSPAVAMVSYRAMGALIFTLYFMKKRCGLREPIKRYSALSPLVFIDVLHYIFHFGGIILVEVVYFISIKRLSILISLILGKLVFRETHFKLRLAGATVMLAGAAIIIFFGKI